MNIRCYPELPTHRTAVVPGNFDGVHRGHRALLTGAARAGLPVVALTFDPHPTRYFSKDLPPFELTSVDRRVELLRASGAEYVAVAAFDETLAAQSPQAFATSVFRDALRAKRVVTGADFRFGHRRAGTIDTLRALGEELDFATSCAEPVLFGDRVVSSTWVREAIGHGDLDLVRSLLGRVHDVEGEVVRGQARGREFGFPTANVDVRDGVLPPHGVYAVAARVLGDPQREVLGGVANLGVRPTFEAGLSFEVHLFGQRDDLYGRRLRVAFGARLRGEKKFDGVESLRAQISEDTDKARILYGENATEWTRWL